ncbi:MAG: hypothetical protein ACR2QF_08660 [Geminicoccaceae bacterium]
MFPLLSVIFLLVSVGAYAHFYFYAELHGDISPWKAIHIWRPTLYTTMIAGIIGGLIIFVGSLALRDSDDIQIHWLRSFYIVLPVIAVVAAGIGARSWWLLPSVSNDGAAATGPLQPHDALMRVMIAMTKSFAGIRQSTGTAIRMNDGRIMVIATLESVAAHRIRERSGKIWLRTSDNHAWHADVISMRGISEDSELVLIDVGATKKIHALPLTKLAHATSITEKVSMLKRSWLGGKFSAEGIVLSRNWISTSSSKPDRKRLILRTSLPYSKGDLGRPVLAADGKSVIGIVIDQEAETSVTRVLVVDRLGGSGKSS